ncbi:MAG: hypothetical protein KKE02_05795 [Alphaproteobacteria bacterium]|nr:hypothetical protein [Alphaproteobacteria bacterium]MBU1512930.1 hypothetical protein [Alphaproteobacteria bacterium]MBU2096629.1 hypothetical protein [Alphaproteobacteria bacterium]MBU2150512.1 hypothetical protein [Alphaproteobacteria bacterium]MBU2306559.1 hypothetical protein [Alphaproteobacteria bacterium]
MSASLSGSPARALALFGLLSVVAVAIGCGVAAASGVPPGAWVRNPVSWCVGALAAVLILRLAGPRTRLAFLAAAPVGLLATLANAGQLGVHRWLDLGPLHINAAQVLLPPAIVACAASSAGRARPWVAAVVMALLVVQPDASQATAFGGALFALIGVSRLSRPLRAAAMAAVGVAIAASWLRPDPLAPVPEVEEIMRLAWAVSPVAAIAAWAALFGAVGSFAFIRTPGAGSRALCAYAALSALTPLLGPFPVPLVGMAMSPILGLWLGAGLLAAEARRAAVSANNPAASAG